MTCGLPNTPYLHTFEGATSHPFNSFVGTDQFPDNHTCLCGAMPWKAVSPWEVFEMIQKDKEGMLQEVKRFI